MTRSAAFVCVVGFLGSTVLAAASSAILSALQSPAGLGTVVAVGLLGPAGLLAWSRLWRRPWDAAAVVGLSVVGLVFGFLLGLVLLWTTFPEHRPNLVLGS